jgi:cysteinyl-tRNA synthetase
VDLKDESLVAAENSLKRIDNFLFRLKTDQGQKHNPTISKHLDTFKIEFEAAMNDDLNTPIALSKIFEFINKVNRSIDSGNFDAENAN